jgi:sugar O-acyltransferase (sialic acid O-acetyltransferase NeuD family)
MTTRIVILGAGGLGREVLQVLRAQRRAGQEVECAGFLVDADFAAPAEVHGVSVYRDFSAFADDPDIRFVVAVGAPAARARIVERIAHAIGERFATVIHPTAVLGDTIAVGAGSVILQTASITADVRIGRHVLVNPRVSISHDCVVEDYVSLSPGVTLAGGVLVEEGCELGSGSTVLPRQRVGRWSIAGAGAVILSPVEANTTVVGVPARRTSERPDNWQRSDRPGETPCEPN